MITMVLGWGPTRRTVKLPHLLRSGLLFQPPPGFLNFNPSMLHQVFYLEACESRSIFKGLLPEGITPASSMPSITADCHCCNCGSCATFSTRLRKGWRRKTYFMREGIHQIAVVRRTS